MAVYNSRCDRVVACDSVTEDETGWLCVWLCDPWCDSVCADRSQVAMTAPPLPPCCTGSPATHDYTVIASAMLSHLHARGRGLVEWD